MEVATRTSKKGRASGGKWIGIKKFLRNEFKFIKHLEKIYIQMNKPNLKLNIIPIYLCCNDWSTDFNILKSLLNDINEDNFMLVGDFNARIGEFTTNKQIANSALKEIRMSKDSTVNKPGNKLISLI